MLLMRLLLTAVLLAGSAASLGNTITLTADTESTAVAPWADLYLDHSAAMSIHDIVQRAGFQPSGLRDISFRFSKARIWFRFSIHNPFPQEQERVLYLQHFLFDELILYTQTDDDFIEQKSGREHLDAHNRSAYPTRFYHFPLTLPPHTTRTYYFSILTEDSISSPLDLVSPDVFQRTLVEDAAIITLYLGLILANLLFAFFMLAKLREIQLLYYIVFVLAHHVVAILMLEGIPASLFDFHSLFWNKTGFILLINIAITSALLFARAFLNVKQTSPRDYLLSRVLVVIMLVSSIQTLVLPHVIASALTTVFCMIVGVGILIMGARRASQDRTARLFLASWSAGIAGATIYGLKLWGVLPINGFTTHAWHIGTIIESIMFSFTIADRVGTERRMRMESQAALLEMETAAKQELEIQVQERTQDITRILAELEHQNKELVELSINDALTKVRNRRFFNDAYPERWQEAERNKVWISVILVDIDHFKAVNDTYGHLAGDQCLAEVAHTLKQSVNRPKDLICRYGGEEFIIVLYDTDLCAAKQVAERLRQSISECTIQTDAGTLNVTASLGVAAIIPEPDHSPIALISVCDEALYESKSKGRNQVSCARTSPAQSPYGNH